jgi:hypothetical protein
MPVDTMTHPVRSAHVELLVEQIPRAAAADRVVVDSELPGQVALDASRERGASELELSAAAGDEAGAADDDIERGEYPREPVDGIGNQVAGDQRDPRRAQFGHFASLGGIHGGDRRRA